MDAGLTIVPDAGTTPSQIGPVRLSFSAAHNIARPLYGCLERLIRNRWHLAAEDVVNPLPFGEAGWLVWDLHHRVDTVFNGLSAGRMVLGFEWMSPIDPAVACADWPLGPPYPESCFDLFEKKSEVIIGFESAAPVDWTFFEDPHTQLKSHGETSLIVNPTPVLVRDLQQQRWNEETLSLQACAGELLEPL